MITLEKLGQITTSYNKELKKNIASTDEEEFLNFVDNLENRLINTAKKGISEASIIFFSSESLIDKNDIEIFEKFGVSIFETDIEHSLTGITKRVYDYLKENNLNPYFKKFEKFNTIIGLSINIKW